MTLVMYVAAEAGELNTSTVMFARAPPWFEYSADPALTRPDSFALSGFDDPCEYPEGRKPAAEEMTEEASVS